MGESDTGGSDGLTPITRRQFLAGAGGVACATAAPAALSEPVTAGKSVVDEPIDTGPPYGDSQISIDGFHELATHEYEQQKNGNGLQFGTKVDAVADLGCEPNGKPIQETLNSKIKDGMLVVFPAKTFIATGEINPDADKFGIVGAGFQNTSKPPKPGKNSTVFKIETGEPIKLFNAGPAKQALIANFVIDQRKHDAHGGVTVRSSGNVRLRDIRTVGAETAVGNGDSTPYFFEPKPVTDDSLIVLERCIARGGGIPGTKNIGAPAGVGIFQRNGTHGKVVLKDCVIENMADNGVYGARTTSIVMVLGGLYRNNDVSQVRVNGDARVDGVDIVIDEKNYTGLKSKRYAKERGPGWPSTNGLKLETDPVGAVTAGTTVKNCNFVGRTLVDVSTIGGLVNLFPSAGGATFDNCRFTNHIPETTSLVAGNPENAPQPWGITVKHSVIQGKGAGQDAAVNISGRPNSVIKDVCLKYSGASRSDIKGAGASNVSYGRQCKPGSGLKNPGKVGSGGNFSSLPAPAINGSYPPRGGPSKRKKQRQESIFKIVTGGFMVMLFVLLGMIAVLVGGIVAAVGSLAALLGGSDE